MIFLSARDSVSRMWATALLMILQCHLLVGTPLTSISNGASMMPTVQDISVKCGRSGMTVFVAFDRPFTGVIYSKGHYYDSACNYASETAPGSSEFSFLIPVDSCGTTGYMNDPTPERDMYFENTIIIQNDPLIQEIWDVARTLKCSWKHTFSKSVKTNSFEVQKPTMVRVDFDSRSVNTLMQIQSGAAPFGSPASGYIYVGEETSVVIYLKDSTKGKLDANPVSCVARSSKGRPLELVDRNGCSVRPELMGPFAKLRNPEGVDADVMIYSYLKGFQINEDPDFQISCELEVCEGSCLPPCALGPYSPGGNTFLKRGKRSTDGGQVKTVTLTHNATVVTRNQEIERREDPIQYPEEEEEELFRTFSFRPLHVILFLNMSIMVLLMVAGICLVRRYAQVAEQLRKVCSQQQVKQ